jgi:hypothetical protein
MPLIELGPGTGGARQRFGRPYIIQMYATSALQQRLQNRNGPHGGADHRLGGFVLDGLDFALRAAQAPAAAQPTVWDGVFTVAQADRGKISFEQLRRATAKASRAARQGPERRPVLKDWKESTVAEL